MIRKNPPIFGLLLLLALPLSAQKIKVKKDVVLFDDVEVAKVVKIDKDKDIYSFLDIDSSQELFQADYELKQIMIGEKGYADSHIILSKEGAAFVNDIDLESLTFSFKTAQNIAEMLAVKYDFFGRDGIHYNKIDAFFSQAVPERPGKVKLDQMLENHELEQAREENEAASTKPDFDINSFNDRVAIDDDVVSIDGQEVFKIDFDRKQKEIIYKDLEHGKNVLIAHYNAEIMEDKTIQYLELEDPNTGRTNSVDRGSYTGTLNERKGVTAFMFGKLGIIGPNGVDQNKFDAFFAEDRVRESLAEKAEYTQKLALNRETIKEKGIVFDDEWNVFYGGDQQNWVGRLEFTDASSYGKDNMVRVYQEPDEMFLAKAHYANMKGGEIETFDGKRIPFKDSFSNTSKGKTAKFICETLLLHGYPFDKTYIQPEEAVYEAKLAQSPNIYNEEGYVVVHGETIQGTLSMMWETLIDPTDDRPAHEKREERKKVSNSVRVNYTNEDGQYMSSWFSWKLGTVFFVKKTDGTYTKYFGFDTMENDFDTVLGIMGNSYDTSTYYEIVKEYKGILIFKHPLKGFYGIKLPSKDYGFAFTGSNGLNEFLRLKDHTECDFPTSYYDLDLTHLDDIIKLTDYFDQNCSQ